MRIFEGLWDHMVLQRSANNVCNVEFRGRSNATGPVKASVQSEGRLLPGFIARTIGESAGGRCVGRLQGIPAGGPYDIILWVGEETNSITTISDVCVGDVWILAGQSNMQGCGRLEDADTPDPLVRAFYMNDRWGVAKDPIHNISESVDQVHANLCGGARPAPSTVTGVGPGVSFAKEMLRRTGVPQGVIACAHGGTSLAQWDPKLRRLRGKSLYGAMLRRFRKNGAKVAGVVWYQGCSDTTPESVRLYTARMKALVRSMRRDLGNLGLPFVMAQIATVYGMGYIGEWNAVQEQQRLLAEALPALAVVPAVDLPLDDNIHISGTGQQRLGARLAQAMSALVGTADQLPPISLKSISSSFDRQNHYSYVTVEFDNVMGDLMADGRPSGFHVVDENGAPHIFRIALEGNRAILLTLLSPCDLEARHLYYGYGLSPYCNITDAYDRSLPAFGPLLIGKPRAITPFVQTMLVSPIQNSPGRRSALRYPSEEVTFEAVSFAGNFCDVHGLLGTCAKRDGVIYFACTLESPEDMRLALLLGYDGPVKVWMDGKQIFTDSAGSNPSMADEEQIPVNVAAGKHEIVLALGANRGRAYGIYLRAQRKDVNTRAITAGPEHYQMPIFRAER